MRCASASPGGASLASGLFLLPLPAEDELGYARKRLSDHPISQPPSGPVSERRQYHRYVLWFPVTLLTTEGKIGAICRDVSSGGMLVSAAVVVPPDSALTCRFRLSAEASDELVTRGRVIRCDRNVDDLELVFPYRVAIAFDPRPPEIEEALKNAQARLRDR